jgi:hypothetical protein
MAKRAGHGKKSANRQKCFAISSHSGTQHPEAAFDILQRAYFCYIG